MANYRYKKRWCRRALRPGRAALLRQLQLAAAQVQTVGGRAGGGEDVRMEAIDDEAALLFGLEDPLTLEDLQMVRDVGDFLAQFSRDLADVFGPAAKRLDDPQAVGVGQGLQPFGAFLGRERVLH